MLTDQVINLVGVAYAQEAYPHEALPVITFEDAMQFHINGEKVDLVHFGEAHTTGDTAVIFRVAMPCILVMSITTLATRSLMRGTAVRWMESLSFVSRLSRKLTRRRS